MRLHREPAMLRVGSEAIWQMDRGGCGGRAMAWVSRNVDGCVNAGDMSVSDKRTAIAVKQGGTAGNVARP